MRKCLFCDAELNKANRAKEHTIPRWLVRRLGCEDDQYLSQTLTYPNEPNEVVYEKDNSINSQILGSVCKNCNGGWMSALEVEVAPIIEALWRPNKLISLTPENCLTLARWTFKTAVEVGYGSAYKKIIPIDHVHDFYKTQCLPANATVDLSYCSNSDRFIQTLQGGNKQYALRDSSIQKKDLESSYLMTLHFDHLMLRLGWTPIHELAAQPFPLESVFRVFPPEDRGLVVHLPRTAKLFRDHFQWHFKFTVFMENEVFRKTFLKER